MNGPFPEYTGNCPKNVSKDAKYSVRSGTDGPEVGLVYVTDNGDEWHPTTRDHPDLVEMVNAVKLAMGGTFNGPFYINEFGQVIVPAGPDARYYLAGEYEGLVEFLFEGNILSGRGVDLAGRSFEVNDEWTGPHPGIPYVVEASGIEVRYDTYPRAGVKRKVKLSTYIGAADARELAQRVFAVKRQSGRFYVNEWREIFAPVSEGGSYSYRYVGHLDPLDDPWFPKPT